MPVVVAPAVEREVPPAVRLVGTVNAARRSVVAAEVAGVVAAWEAEEGQFLKAGDVIARLDDTVARLRVDEARATLRSREAELAKLEAGERKEELERLEALVAESEAVFRKWEVERRRIEDLHARGQSSDKERHDTEMDYLAARGRLLQARAQLAAARNGARPEDLLRAREQVAAQQAVLRRLERDLDKTTIRAPFDGAVTARRTEIGQWIEAGGPVAELVALDTVKIRADVPEAAIPFAVAGAAATVEVETLGRRWAARITRAIPQANPAARTFPVEIDLENPDRQLLPGMFVWAHVPSGPAGARLMVPKDALVARGPEKTIFVVRSGPEGTPTALPLSVTTGLEVGGEIEVQAPGLSPGDLVVVRANERLRGPSPVIPTPLPPPRTVTPEPAAPGSTTSAEATPAAAVPRRDTPPAPTTRSASAGSTAPS